MKKRFEAFCVASRGWKWELEVNRFGLNLKMCPLQNGELSEAMSCPPPKYSNIRKIFKCIHCSQTWVIIRIT